MSMSASFLDRITQLYRSFIQHDATQSDHLKRYRNIKPDSAQYIAMLIRIQQSKSILEIGTSTGYSSLWMADALQVTQGKMTTVEIEAERSTEAQSYAQELKLDHLIDYYVGDAKDYLAAQQHQKFDLILLDAERNAYASYWPYLQEMFNFSGGVLIVDKVISHALEVKDFIELVKQDPRFMTATLQLGAGLFIVTPKSQCPE